MSAKRVASLALINTVPASEDRIGLEYLTNWRMYKATALLREDHRKLIEVARSVGYDSDAALSKTFKRVLGVAPGEYRRSAVD